MKIKGLSDEDFVNYKKPCMFISTSKCSFKCDIECGRPVCQNSSLANANTFNIEDWKLIQRYINNPITEAVVIGGLEPFDTFDELVEFIMKFRMLSEDDIVIYTGYNPEEIKDKLLELNKLFVGESVIVKFGRFIPDSTEKYDELLGVRLSSPNQFAERLNKIVHKMK